MHLFRSKLWFAFLIPIWETAAPQKNAERDMKRIFLGDPAENQSAFIRYSAFSGIGRPMLLQLKIISKTCGIIKPFVFLSHRFSSFPRRPQLGQN
jgi:hypothetical protein